jgi:hypothetical protein
MRYTIKIKTQSGTTFQEGIFPNVWDAIAAGEAIKGEQEGFVTASPAR